MIEKDKEGIKNMEAKKMILTYSGLKSLEEELEKLKVVTRKEVAAKIKEAREQGDLSENAEYDAAKEAQGLLELKISKLEDMIANARIIDESRINTTHIQIMNKVKLKNISNDSVVEYTLVGETEANLREGKLAAATPIGRALIGKKKGDVVEVNVPSGVLKFEILEISK